MPYYCPWLIRGSTVTCRGTASCDHPLSGKVAAPEADCHGVIATPLSCRLALAQKPRHLAILRCFLGTPVSSQHIRAGPPGEPSRTQMLLSRTHKVSHYPNESVSGGRWYTDVFQRNLHHGNLPCQKIYITNTLQNPTKAGLNTNSFYIHVEATASASRVFREKKKAILKR